MTSIPVGYAIRLDRGEYGERDECVTILREHGAPGEQ
jgi:hypothetical protein